MLYFNTISKKWSDLVDRQKIQYNKSGVLHDEYIHGDRVKPVTAAVSHI